MSESSYKSLRIVNKKLCSIVKVDYDLDKYNKPQSNYPTTYVANGILDLYFTKNILNNTLLGKKTLPYITDEFNSDIDTQNDIEKVKFFLAKKINKMKYQDYVIKNGKFVGKFDLMFKKYKDPWKLLEKNKKSTMINYRMIIELCKFIKEKLKKRKNYNTRNWLWISTNFSKSL